MIVLTHVHLFAVERVDEPTDHDVLCVRTMSREGLQFLFGMIRWNEWDPRSSRLPIEDGDDADLPFLFRARIERKSFAFFVERASGMKDNDDNTSTGRERARTK